MNIWKMKEKNKMEMKMVMNNYIFDAIRASLTKDINKAYNIFKDKYIRLRTMTAYLMC